MTQELHYESFYANVIWKFDSFKHPWRDNLGKM